MKHKKQTNTKERSNIIPLNFLSFEVNKKNKACNLYTRATQFKYATRKCCNNLLIDAQKIVFYWHKASPYKLLREICGSQLSNFT